MSGTGMATKKLIFYPHLKNLTSHKKKKRICAFCKIEKDWIFKNYCGMKRVYIDGDGRTWQSKLCGPCHTKKYKTYKPKGLRDKKAKPATEDEIIEMMFDKNL